MGTTLDDIGATGGAGYFLNLDAKKEILKAGAAFSIVDAEPLVEGTDGFDDQTIFHIQFDSGTQFDFMPDDADDDTVYKLGLRHTKTRQKKAEACLKHFAVSSDPIVDAVLITGKSKTPGHSDWWDIDGRKAEEPPARTQRSTRSAPPARRAAPAPDDDDGI